MSDFTLWLAVVLVSTITLGNYFLFDLPGSVGVGSGETWQRRFHDHHETYTETMNGLLYSIYSWPNMILAAVGGVLVDNVLGLRRSAFVFTSLVLLGSYITSVGVARASYSLLLVGRVLFGLGGETQIVAQYSFVGNWFDNRPGAGVAFGIIAAVQRVGAGATFWLGPRVAKSFGVTNATDVAVVIAGFCMVTLFFTIVLHRRLSTRSVEVVVPQGGLWNSIKKAATRPVIALGIGNALVSMGLYGFAAVAVRLLEVCLDMSAPAAGSAVTCFYAAVVVAAPVLGSVIERVGRPHVWLVTSTLGAGLLTLVFASGAFNGYVYCLLLALPQAVVLAAVYPLVAKYVRQESEGFAFGLLVSLQNMGMAVATFSNGIVLDDEAKKIGEVDGYRVLLCIEGCCYIASAVVFFYVSMLPMLEPEVDGEKQALVTDDPEEMVEKKKQAASAE